MDAMLSSVADSLNAGALEKVAGLRARPEDVDRIEWLGQRANDGLLTDEERQEYQSAVMFASFLGILQSKARIKLRGSKL